MATTRRQLERFKPAAPASAHLLLAAVLWSAVGTGLLTAGLRWSLGAESPWGRGLLPVALAAGIGKALFVLSRTAKRTISRIKARGDGRCLGGFISWQSWLIVIVMMAGGSLLRRSPTPRMIVGLVYAGVGAALFTASLYLWSAWHAHRREVRARLTLPHE